MFDWKIKEMKATNAIFLGDKTEGEGRPFKARFLQAGLVKYDFGVCLLKKETIDRFVNTFIDCPVIINHKDDIKKEDKQGTIKSIWFAPEDGWFWCSGVLDEEAAKKVEKGFNVSCQYRITEYSNNTENKLHNGNPYDKEILNGVFEHLAIVNNPRYEDAYIAVNAIMATNEDHWITIGADEESGKKGTHVLVKDGETNEEATKRKIAEWKEKGEKKEEEKNKTDIDFMEDKEISKEQLKSALENLVKKYDAKSEKDLMNIFGNENNLKLAITKEIEKSTKTSDKKEEKEERIEARRKHQEVVKKHNQAYKDFEDGKITMEELEKADRELEKSNKEFYGKQSDKPETKEEEKQPIKKYNYTLTKKEVENDSWLGGMADTGNYYTNGAFAIDKNYLDIKGQEPKKVNDIDKNVKELLTTKAKERQSKEKYTTQKDFEIGELKREYGKPVKVAKYSYYDDKYGYTRNIYIDKKYNDLFKNFELKFGTEVDPIYAYDNGKIIGSVMPINAKEQTYTKAQNDIEEEETEETKEQLKLFKASNTFLDSFKDFVYNRLTEELNDRLGE